MLNSCAKTCCNHFYGCNPEEDGPSCPAVSLGTSSKYFPEVCGGDETDVDAGCSELAGWCSRKSQYLPWMRANCAQTCCGVTAAAQQADVCSDTAGTCAELEDVDLGDRSCSNWVDFCPTETGTYIAGFESFMLSNCPKTCCTSAMSTCGGQGFCTANPAKSAFCLSSFNYWSTLCQEPGEMGWLNAHCQGMCRSSTPPACLFV